MYNMGLFFETHSYRAFLCNINVCMLNLFTFDAFSVTQSVTQQHSATHICTEDFIQYKQYKIF